MEKAPGRSGNPRSCGVLKDHEIDSVILYIKSLAAKTKKK